MRKKMISLTFILIVLFSITAAMADTKDAGIIHDGEYNYLRLYSEFPTSKQPLKSSKYCH